MQAANVTTKAVGFVFLTLVFSLAFMRPHIRTAGMALQVTDLLFLVFAVTFIIWAIANRIRPGFDVFTFLILAYFTTLTLSAAFSSDVGFSFKKLVGEAYLLMLALMVREVVQKLDILKQTVLVLIAAGTITSIVGALTVAAFYIDKDSFLLTYFLHHYGSLTPGNYPRIHSTFLYPAMLCNFLTVSLLLTLAAKYVGWLNKRLYFPILIVHAISIIFTVTPGLGGVIFCVAVWFYIKDQEKVDKLRTKLVMAFGVCSTLFFTIVAAFSFKPITTSPYHFELYGHRIDPTQRLLTWQRSFETFIANPLHGIGLGIPAANVSFVTPAGNPQLLTDAHNTFLSIAAQSGFPALVFFCLILFWLFRHSLPWKLYTRDHYVTICTTIAIALVSAFLVQGMVGAFENARHLWLVTGILAAIPDLSKGTSKDPL